MVFVHVRKLTLLACLMLGAPALACRTVYCAQRLAPANGQSLPANAQAVIAHGRPDLPSFGPAWRPWIRRIDADGGVQELFALEPVFQPTGSFGDATLFGPGALIEGERFRLESSADCDFANPEPSAEVVVGPPAAMPTRLGVPVASPSTRVDPDGLSCGPSDPYTTSEVSLELDDSVRPWLAIARVNLTFNRQTTSTDYGRLARGFDGGSRVFVQTITRMCTSDTLETWPVRLELELPAEGDRPPPIEFDVELDCRQSCSSAGLTPWILASLLVARRRRAKG